MTSQYSIAALLLTSPNTPNTPDELDVLSVEELVALENGILLEQIDASRSSATRSLTEVIAEDLCSRDEKQLMK